MFGSAALGAGTAHWPGRPSWEPDDRASVFLPTRVFELRAWDIGGHLSYPRPQCPSHEARCCTPSKPRHARPWHHWLLWGGLWGLLETRGGRYTFFPLQASFRALRILTSLTDFPNEARFLPNLGLQPSLPLLTILGGKWGGGKTNLRSKTDGTAQINYSRP